MSSFTRKAWPILRSKAWRAGSRNASTRAELVDLTLTPTTGPGPEASKFKIFVILRCLTLTVNGWGIMTAKLFSEVKMETTNSAALN